MLRTEEAEDVFTGKSPQIVVSPEIIYVQLTLSRLSFMCMCAIKETEAINLREQDGLHWKGCREERKKGEQSGSIIWNIPN